MLQAINSASSNNVKGITPLPHPPPQPLPPAPKPPAAMPDNTADIVPAAHQTTYISCVERTSLKRLLPLAAATFTDVFRGSYIAIPKVQRKSCLQMQSQHMDKLVLTCVCTWLLREEFTLCLKHPRENCNLSCDGRLTESFQVGAAVHSIPDKCASHVYCCCLSRDHDTV